MEVYVKEPIIIYTSMVFPKKLGPWMYNKKMVIFLWKMRSEGLKLEKNFENVWFAVLTGDFTRPSWKMLENTG